MRIHFHMIVCIPTVLSPLKLCLILFLIYHAKQGGFAAEQNHEFCAVCDERSTLVYNFLSFQRKCSSALML